MNRFRVCLVVLLASLAGCSDVDTTNDLPALGWDQPVGFLDRAAQGLAHPGAWELPASTEAIGELQNVLYESAGPWNGGAACAPWLLSGTVELRDAIYGYFPQVFSIGGYNCRPINGNSNSLSQHGTGRALDIYIALDGTQADNDSGDPVANWLVENAEAIGVQGVIWDRTIWKSDHTPKAYPYSGAHPHHDHIHVELNNDGGNGLTSWFGEPYGPEPCALVAAGGGVVSEDGPCFLAFGPSTYWRAESGVGEGGALLWTNAFSSSQPSNWARWVLNFDTAGYYRVETFIDAAWGVYPATRYAVRAAGSDHEIILDQSAADGWTLLGDYPFAAGGDQSVSVFDNYAGTVASSQHIAVDAVRLTPTLEPPCQLVGVGGGVLEETGPCFEAFGPAQFWHDAAGVGHDGSLQWTNAFESDTPSNYARWRIFMTRAGDYELSVYLDPAFALYPATRYSVRAVGVETTVIVDQSAASGWTSLGIFAFAAGGDQELTVYDNYVGSVAADQHIAADAIRLVPAGFSCGDGACDASEECDVCVADCGACNPVGGDADEATGDSDVAGGDTNLVGGDKAGSYALGDSGSGTLTGDNDSSGDTLVDDGSGPGCAASARPSLAALLLLVWGWRRRLVRR